MKKYWYILMMLCAALVISSCSDDDDDIYEIYADWRLENEEALEKYKKDPEFKELESMGNNGSIYYKVLKEGDGDKQIYYTSTVKLYYTGKYVNDTVFDSAEPPYQKPAVMSVGGVVEGFATALQWMKEGDRWEIFIPYNLGYGAGGDINYYTGKYNILPFSHLKFEIEVVEIVEQ